MTDRSILLVIGGGVAAYKSLELIRLLAKAGVRSRVFLQPFVVLYRQID